MLLLCSEAAYAFGGAFDPPQQTMMQQLLADRRRRVRQHQLKLLQGRTILQ